MLALRRGFCSSAASASAAAAAAKAACPVDAEPGSESDLLRRIGLGSWNSATAGTAVREGIKAGYTHIDCAHIYNNEPEIGKTAFSDLTASARGQMFVTSKLWCTEFHPDDVLRNCAQTLKDLQLDYLDLYMIHWPVALAGDCPGRGSLTAASNMGVTELASEHFSPVPLCDTWQAMELLVEKGLVRQIGLCNSGPGHVEDIMSNCSVVPAMIQNEMHPYLSQDTFLADTTEMGIGMTAYSPLGSPARPVQAPDDPVLMEETIVIDIAEEHGMTPAQVLLRWGLQRGTVVIPKSATPSRIKANLEAATVGEAFQLSDAEMHSIASLEKGKGDDPKAGRLLTGEFWLKPGQTLNNFWGLEGPVRA